MGAHKKIGISKTERLNADKYARRFRFQDYRLDICRKHGDRRLYFIGSDDECLIYRIRYKTMVKMKSPKGWQILNKKDYLVTQSNKVHGIDKYDFSLVKDEDITKHGKINIICKKHGVFKKRKSSHISDAEGCPTCSAERMTKLRRF